MVGVPSHPPYHPITQSPTHPPTHQPTHPPNHPLTPSPLMTSTQLQPIDLHRLSAPFPQNLLRAGCRTGCSHEFVLLSLHFDATQVFCCQPAPSHARSTVHPSAHTSPPRANCKRGGPPSTNARTNFGKVEVYHIQVARMPKLI